MFLVGESDPDSAGSADAGSADAGSAVGGGGIGREPLAPCHTEEGLAESAARRMMDDRIGVLSAQIHSLEAELAVTVAEFDAAGGWQDPDFRSMAHWLSIRTKFTVRDCQRISRVAQNLESIPTLITAARDGRISLGILDAAARVTTPENEETVARVALACTPSQLSKVLSVYRDLTPTPDPDTDTDTDTDPDPGFWWRVWEDNKGRGRVDAALDATTTALMNTAWQAACARHERDLAAAGDTDTTPGTDTNAVAEELATAMIDAANRSGLRDSGDEKFLALVHLDIQTFANIFGLDVDPTLPFRLGSECFLPDTGRHLSNDEAARFLEAGNIQVLIHHNGVPLWLSNETRLFTKGQRRAMRYRSGGRGGCEFPGCTHTHHLHGHHVLFHTDGEATTLDNGVYLCSYHHRRLHKKKWHVTLNGDQTYTFWNGPTCLGTTMRRTQPGGRAPDLMQLPELDTGPADAPAHITPDTPKSATRGERLTRYALDVYLEHLLTAS